MNKIKSVLKGNNIKYVMLGIIILLLFLLTFNKFKISNLEKLTIKKYGNEIMPYMDLIKEDKIDYYVQYAIAYYKGEYNLDKVSVKDITKFINTHFNKKVKEDEVRQVANTKIFIDNQINYDIVNDQYVKDYDIDKQLQKTDMELVKYDIAKIKKQDKDTIIVTYNKYVVDNIYTLLNYYIEKDDKKAIDTINNSLKNKYYNTDILSYINKDMKKTVKNKGQVRIKYIINGDNILIKK